MRSIKHSYIRLFACETLCRVLQIEQVRRDQSVVEKSLKDHVTKVEQQKRDGEEEVSRLKATLVGDRMKAEEELSKTRQKLKADQVSLTKPRKRSTVKSSYAPGLR